MGGDGKTLFELHEPLPAHCLRSGQRSAVSGQPASSTSTGTRAEGGPASGFARRGRRRLRKWSRDRAGRRIVSTQYLIIKMFAERGLITTREMLSHEDDHVRASGKQRIRDCVHFGVKAAWEGFGDHGVWRVDAAGRRECARLVALADRYPW